MAVIHAYEFKVLWSWRGEKSGEEMKFLRLASDFFNAGGVHGCNVKFFKS